MAEVTRDMIDALALDILARVERLDADIRDLLGEVRTIRAEGKPCARLAAARQDH